MWLKALKLGVGTNVGVGGQRYLDTHWFRWRLGVMGQNAANVQLVMRPLGKHVLGFPLDHHLCMF